MNDYYNILGVERNSTLKDVKFAYKKMATLYHPDKCGNANNEKFLSIQEAYNTLSNIKKRERYNNIFEKNNTNKNKKFNMTISITLDEAYKGCIKTVVHKATKKTYLITIPPKSCLGDVVAIQTDHGNISISIMHKNTEHLYIEDNVIISVTEIDYLTMLTGGKVFLNILGTKVPFHVKECSPHELILNLPDPLFNGYQLKAKIKTKMPNKLSEDEKDLLNIIKKRNKGNIFNYNI